MVTVPEEVLGMMIPKIRSPPVGERMFFVPEIAGAIVAEAEEAAVVSPFASYWNVSMRATAEKRIILFTESPSIFLCLMSINPLEAKIRLSSSFSMMSTGENVVSSLSLRYKR